MEASIGIEKVTVKEEPVDTDVLSGDEDFAVNCSQLCSVQYEDEVADSDGKSQPLADPLGNANPTVKADSSVKAEPPDNQTGASEIMKKEEAVEPPVPDSSYSTKCEMICAAENEESNQNKEPQPNPSTSAASKAEDNFEFISVGAIKQEEPEWTSDADDADPNPLQETSEEGRKPTLQQDDDPDPSNTAGHSTYQGYECGLCQKVYHERDLFVPHIKTHYAATIFQCEVCSVRSDCISDLERHSLAHNRERKVERKSELCGRRRVHTGEKPYRCELCGKTFKNMSHVTAHHRTHTGEKPHHCEICKKQFSNRSNLNTHITIHTGEKPYHCVVCKKQFSNRSNLNTHITIHTGEQPHHCAVCKKQFNYMSQLRKHNRMHTGEKPHRCQVCQKQFNSLSSLATHNFIHTGEKPFTCGDCEKQFNNMSNLTKHKRIHTGEKPYTCEVCQKEFNNMSNLTSHSRIHTGESPYHCGVCEKKFNNLSNLMKHRRIHSSDN